MCSRSADALQHALLFFLQRHESFAKQRAAFIKLLNQVHGDERVPLSLVPLVGADMAAEISSRQSFEGEQERPKPAAAPQPLAASAAEVAELLEDLGYSCHLTTLEPTRSLRVPCACRCMLDPRGWGD